MMANEMPETIDFALAQISWMQSSIHYQFAYNLYNPDW